MTETSTDETVAPAWATRLSSDLNANDRAAKELVAGLSEEQLNWRPAPGCWSVGQCLEHLCITGELYLPPMAGAIQGKPSRRVEQIVPGWLGRWFIRNFVEPSPKSKKVDAPNKIKPAAQVGLGVLERFLTGNQKCRELMRAAREADVNRIRFWNPFIPGLRWTVGTGLEIIAGHERRHLLQAKQVKESVNFPH